MGKCDNCKTGLIIKDKDYTTEAVLVVQMVQRLVLVR